MIKWFNWNSYDILQIPVIADLPGVGENLQTHGIFFDAFTVNISTLNLEQKLSDDLNVNEYIERRTGNSDFQINKLEQNNIVYLF